MDWLLIAVTGLNIYIIIIWSISIEKFKKEKKASEKEPYIEKARLNQICWVRALERLEHIRKDPEITHASMILGWQNGGGHAWIEYQRGKDIIQYDPTTEKVVIIKDSIKPVEPKEPQWRLKLKQFLSSCKTVFRPMQKRDSQQQVSHT